MGGTPPPPPCDIPSGCCFFTGLPPPPSSSTDGGLRAKRDPENCHPDPCGPVPPLKYLTCLWRGAGPCSAHCKRRPSGRITKAPAFTALRHATDAQGPTLRRCSTATAIARESAPGTCVSSAVQAPCARASARRRLRDAPSSLSTAALFPRGCRPPRAHGPAEMRGTDPLVRASVVSAGPHCAITGPQEGCMRREGTSEAVRQAVGGGCQSGWGRLLSVTNAIEAGTWRQGDSGWA